MPGLKKWSRTIFKFPGIIRRMCWRTKKLTMIIHSKAEANSLQCTHTKCGNKCNMTTNLIIARNDSACKICHPVVEISHTQRFQSSDAFKILWFTSTQPSSTFSSRTSTSQATYFRLQLLINVSASFLFPVQVSENITARTRADPISLSCMYYNAVISCSHQELPPEMYMGPKIPAWPTHFVHFYSPARASPWLGPLVYTSPEIKTK